MRGRGMLLREVLYFGVFVLASLKTLAIFYDFNMMTQPD